MILYVYIPPLPHVSPYRVIVLRVRVGRVSFALVFIRRCMEIGVRYRRSLLICFSIGVIGISLTDVFLYRRMRTWVHLGNSMSIVLYILLLT